MCAHTLNNCNQNRIKQYMPNNAFLYRTAYCMLAKHTALQA